MQLPFEVMKVKSLRSYGGLSKFSNNNDKGKEMETTIVCRVLGRRFRVRGGGGSFK